MRTFVCAKCGQTVEIPGYTRNIKYCPDCREKVNKERDRIRSKNRTIKGQLNELQAMDTPENIATCLDCPIPGKCRMNSVACPLYRRKGA